MGSQRRLSAKQGGYEVSENCQPSNQRRVTNSRLPSYVDNFGPLVTLAAAGSLLDHRQSLK